MSSSSDDVLIPSVDDRNTDNEIIGNDNDNDDDDDDDEEEEDNEDDDNDDKPPLCSVLCTVIRHEMSLPTPLEPEEFCNTTTETSTTTTTTTTTAATTTNNSVQVPILRVFGPIIRGDAPSGTDPVQTACLYIHGAYPYLLARPVLAGPDGSLHHSSHLWNTTITSTSKTTTPTTSQQPPVTSAGHIDWDNEETVSQITTTIQDSLETALQASMVNQNSDNNNIDKTTQSTTTKTVATTVFIRKITVVMGRGFYTYCPGPPAPFLRVEYYNPKFRWKVKLLLERGLDLPSKFHPDPQQYDATAQDDNHHHHTIRQQQLQQDVVEPLKFQCYEAHIPYTMQFFKDWNLSGMAYIHLSGGKFRRQLKTNVVVRWRQQQREVPEAMNGNGTSNIPCSASFGQSRHNNSNTGNDEQGKSQDKQDSSSQFAFLTSNTPTEHVWRVQDNNESTTNAFWTKKETYCDVEIDVHVRDIMNVKTVMKFLPDNDAERKNIHWRAVPSLREIWQEERRRMSKILHPKDDFLSRPDTNTTAKLGEQDVSTPPFTLSVKKDASTPGAELATKGMKRLLNITEGLEEDFMRASRQIVTRHSLAISNVDKLLYASPSNAQPSRDNGVYAKPGSTSMHEDSALQSTPEVDAALEALGALASQFGDTDANDLGRSKLQVLDLTIGPEDDTERLKLNSNQDWTHKNDAVLNLSQSQGGSSNVSNQMIDKEYEQLSQRVDQGEIILNNRLEKAEEFINPETLVPYDSCDEGNDDESDDELDEEGLERVLTALHTRHEMELGFGQKQAGLNDDFDAANSNFGDVLSLGSASLASDGNAYSDSDDVNDECSTIAVGMEKLNSSQDLSTKASACIKPPTRGDLKDPSAKLFQLCPKDSSNSVPSWLGHAARYQSFRTKSNVKTNWGVNITLNEAQYIQPTQPPPRRDEVVFWCCHEKKKGPSEYGTILPKKRQEGRDLASASLQVDDNTGKVVKSNGRNVEEVLWEPVQSQAESFTQEAGRDAVEEVANDSPMIAQNQSLTATVDSQLLGIVGDDLCSGTQLNNTAGSETEHALQGMQNQGGRLQVEGGGQLKAKTRPSQSFSSSKQQDKNAPRLNRTARYLPMCLTTMSIEVHVQCRTGKSGTSNATIMAMTPDPERDKIVAIVYAFGRDPGGGESLQILERGCLFVPTEQPASLTKNSLPEKVKTSMPRRIMGISSPLSVEEPCKNEFKLLLRLASIVRRRDPDMLISWDTQGAGLGYIVERGANLGNDYRSGPPRNDPDSQLMKLDMTKLLGRIPERSWKDENKSDSEKSIFFYPQHGGQDAAAFGNGGKYPKNWTGSGLGNDWDDTKGAGAAAASIEGRLVFAGWKIISEEVKHPNFSSLEAMVSTVLSQTIPMHDELNLSNWYACNSGRERWRVLHHRLVQCTATLLLFDALDIIGRAGEAARLSGVEFSQSFPGIRGSQYKVEGVLLRALQSLNSTERGLKRGNQKVKSDMESFTSLSDETKSQATSPWKTRRKMSLHKRDEYSSNCGYFFFSPSLNDTNKQEALEVQALTLEPQSGHHADPVVVCDFTALYPSLVIAYNLCYSTCAGKLNYHTTRREMRREGRTNGRIGPMTYPENRTATVLQHHLKSCNPDNHDSIDCMSPKDRAYITPNGTIFVSETVVRGVLPQVLDELLSTRAMLKKAAKEYKKRVQDLAPSILRQLEARQLALKYVANVTYGYTSATFSGRCAMPILADSIVECGRRTLTNAINLANAWGREESGRWKGAEVLYGDTDSVFIKLPGRSVKEAFEFGEVYCKTVTSLNPPPVQLKLEKVYLGSILQTKKKYCGMKFDSPNTKPSFEAKGIETIRRDQCSLTQKVLRNSLVTLFRHGVHAVKEYLFRQWSLIIAGQLPVSDFILTGRVRRNYRGTGPVQAALHRRLAEADPGRIMRHRQRLQYVIVATPGVNFKLKDCVVTPMELLSNWDALAVFAKYYIDRHVNAALQRCFGLAPHYIDIKTWYSECRKPKARIHFWPASRSMGKSSMITAYFGSDSCSLCGEQCKAKGRSRVVICSKCQLDDVHVALVATRRLQKAQQDATAAANICTACSLCYEDPSTFAPVATVEDEDHGGESSLTRKRKVREELVIPIAACTSTDCPNTFKRHRLREEILEAEAICNALDEEP